MAGRAAKLRTARWVDDAGIYQVTHPRLPGSVNNVFMLPGANRTVVFAAGDEQERRYRVQRIEQRGRVIVIALTNLYAEFG